MTRHCTLQSEFCSWAKMYGGCGPLANPQPWGCTGSSLFSSLHLIAGCTDMNICSHNYIPKGASSLMFIYNIFDIYLIYKGEGALDINIDRYKSKHIKFRRYTLFTSLSLETKRPNEERRSSSVFGTCSCGRAWVFAFGLAFAFARPGRDEMKLSLMFFSSFTLSALFHNIIHLYHHHP